VCVGIAYSAISFGLPTRFVVCAACCVMFAWFVRERQREREKERERGREREHLGETDVEPDYKSVTEVIPERFELVFRVDIFEFLSYYIL
jgi:hypothetical protein